MGAVIKRAAPQPLMNAIGREVAYDMGVGDYAVQKRKDMDQLEDQRGCDPPQQLWGEGIRGVHGEGSEFRHTAAVFDFQTPQARRLHSALREAGTSRWRAGARRWS